MHNSRDKAATFTSLTGINLSKLLNIAEKNEGVGLTSICRNFTAKDNARLHIWTVEREDGLYFPTTLFNPSDHHIVVSHSHAFAVVPSSNFEENHRPPVDCIH